MATSPREHMALSNAMRGSTVLVKAIGKKGLSICYRWSISWLLAIAVTFWKISDKKDTYLEKRGDGSWEGRFLMTQSTRPMGPAARALPWHWSYRSSNPLLIWSQFESHFSLADEIHSTPQLISPLFTPMTFRHFSPTFKHNFFS